MSGFAHEIGPDGRPRPKYGEYATPEEQRARIADPDAAAAHEAAFAPPVAAPAPAPAPAAAPVAASPSAPVDARKPRTADRIATAVLLGYGLFTVLTSIPQFVQYEDYITRFLAVFGVETPLTDPAGARAWGIAAAIVLGVGWVVTAVVSMLRLRTGRLTWWVPLVAGVVVNIAASLLVIMPIMNDPDVWDALQKSLLG